MEQAQNGMLNMSVDQLSELVNRELELLQKPQFRGFKTPQSLLDSVVAIADMADAGSSEETIKRKLVAVYQGTINVRKAYLANCFKKFFDPCFERMANEHNIDQDLIQRARKQAKLLREIITKWLDAGYGTYIDFAKVAELYNTARQSIDDAYQAQRERQQPRRDIQSSKPAQQRKDRKSEPERKLFKHPELAARLRMVVATSK